MFPSHPQLKTDYRNKYQENEDIDQILWIWSCYYNIVQNLDCLLSW